MNIILIGFMGCGKTSLGKGLANKLNWPFIDSDKAIEQMEGVAIPAIFNLKGEHYFRELERNWIANIDSTENAVIAVGGGTPCFFDNMEQLNAKGVTIYLHRPVGELVYRLSHSKNPRPLVQGKSHDELSEFVRETIIKREVFYKKANFSVSRKVGTAQKLYDFIRDQHILEALNIER